ncbi:hypothetical protein [Adhaeribacter aquaticus]|uniref:hypothetical protein n=1 Tax=Adhaeribacter aquaticus TaxID=299567 RepID=UPI000416617B|nr:hypothetical protein [Adhaeribacter aquaticus]
MTLQEFKSSLSNGNPPAGLSSELKAMWYDGKEDWNQAHEIAQEVNTAPHCLVHAYLHRKEGDQWNANYWYNRAGRKMPNVSLAQEWEIIVQEFLVA